MRKDVSSEVVRVEDDYPFKPRVVQIFYESLCPDSARLISDRSTGLWSSYNNMKDTWRFDLYPFGNAARDHWKNVKCQHGREECKGNLVHQCALKVLNTSQSFALIDCFMGTVHATLQAQNATANGGLAQEADSWVYDKKKSRQQKGFTSFKKQVADPCWRKLHQPRWESLVGECVNDAKMKTGLQSYYETETQRVKFSWVPAVYINGSLSKNASHSRDLLSFLD